ncbi:MAG: enoyl-CoA hydratase/isomerase family protein [Nitrospirae bacterium]|nr:enoyl-CoA hydratase/isomerase family protein [Nitrospirota bacterium]
MNTSNSHIKVEKKDRTGIIILNRPEVMNALNTPMLRDLRDSLEELEKDSNITAIIIRGGKDFCAGADIGEMNDKGMEEAKAFSQLGHSICNRIGKLGKPVIAAVNGYALGGGCEISLACDIRIAGRNARFGQTEINIGIIPGWGATQRLPAIIGMGKAKEMIMTGKIITAQEALSIGLVNIITDDQGLIGKAEEMASILSGKSLSAIAKVKRLTDIGSGIEKGLELEIDLFSECFGTDDYRDGMKAFFAKRKP